MKCLRFDVTLSYQERPCQVFRLGKSNARSPRISILATCLIDARSIRHRNHGCASVAKKRPKCLISPVRSPSHLWRPSIFGSPTAMFCCELLYRFINSHGCLRGISRPAHVSLARDPLTDAVVNMATGWDNLLNEACSSVAAAGHTGLLWAGWSTLKQNRRCREWRMSARPL